MLKDNDQSIIKALRIYQNDMLDIMCPTLPFEKYSLFIRCHLCLFLVCKKNKIKVSVKNILTDIKNPSFSEIIPDIQSIFYTLDVMKYYDKIIKSDDLCTMIDAKTKNVINLLNGSNKSIETQLDLLDFFTENLDGRRDDVLSSKGLDQFVDQLALNNLSKERILFPYLQNAFLPVKIALQNQKINITAFEINDAKYAYARLLKLFYNLKSLRLINKSWLHHSLLEGGEIELFDIIVNIAPFALYTTPPVHDPENYPKEFNRSSKTNEVYEQHKILRHLNKNGNGYFLTAKSFAFSGKNTLKFVRKKLLKDQNIQTIFKLPGGLLSATMIESFLFHLTKKTNSEVQFVDTNECFEKVARTEIRLSQSGFIDIFDAVSKGYKLEHRVEKINTQSLISKVSDIDPNRFVDNSEAAQSRRRLLANYSDYNEVSLGSESVSNSIKRYSTVDDFKPEISVILPKIPTKKLKPTSEITDVKPDQYVIELDTNKLLPGYLLHFLKSQLGQLSLNLAARSAYIPTLSMKDVMELKIPLPRLEVQKNIVTAVDKLEAVNTELSDITNDLSSSPTNVEILTSKLDDILNALNELTEPEKAFSKILQGEGELIEFKETFSLDVRRFKNDNNYKATKEEKIEHSSLKTIAAFMNAKGGDLFIGVDDNAVVLGIEAELVKFHKNSLDQYLLHLNNRIQDRFETPVMNMLSVKPLKLSGKIVINIQVSPSKNDPIFLKPNSDFYVRSTPSTEKLTGNGMFSYIKERFSYKRSK